MADFERERTLNNLCVERRALEDYFYKYTKELDIYDANNVDYEERIKFLVEKRNLVEKRIIEFGKVIKHYERLLGK